LQRNADTTNEGRETAWEGLKEKYGATVVRRDRENQSVTLRFERACVKWTRSIELPYGPAGRAGFIEAGHMSAPDHARRFTNQILLAPEGPSTHVTLSKRRFVAE
jgi:hypothetical protein